MFSSNYAYGTEGADPNRSVKSVGASQAYIHGVATSCNPPSYTSSTCETFSSTPAHSWESLGQQAGKPGRTEKPMPSVYSSYPSSASPWPSSSSSSSFWPSWCSFSMLAAWNSRSLDYTRWINKKTLRNNRREFAGWFALLLLIAVGYNFCSDGSFSAILTLASAFQCFALFLLSQKVVYQQSVAGISQRSVALIVACLFVRLCSTLFFNGYLPVDRSGDWLYQIADVLAVGIGCFLLAYSYRWCLASIVDQQKTDTCYVVVPVVATLLLALVVHPTLNRNFIADSLWAYALYLETYSMVPQLFMMGKIGGEVEAVTSHYVASMAASKICSVVFWYFSYTELAPRNASFNFAGWAVLISYMIQTLLYADFLFYYIKSLRVGRKMIIHF